jgi:hypothetical protein
MMQDDESKMPGQTKIITITTPDILSGKIKGIEIKMRCITTSALNLMREREKVRLLVKIKYSTKSRKYSNSLISRK